MEEEPIAFGAQDRRRHCEHLVDACADLVGALLERCTELRVLGTSREPLGLAGEVTWPVPPLSVPEEGTADDRPVERARAAESVQLFLDRARTVRPDFELTPDNVAAVVRVCGRLEGIPLALELAAARVRVLGVEQIAERLERGLDLLSRSGRGPPARHRTMRAALDWSHELLSEPERVLFRRLAVFGGHASLEACEAVCADHAPGNPTTVDLLTRLVDQSLVVVDDPGSCARYRLLEPVRQFALERLEQSGERDGIRSRHAACYLRLARAAAPDLCGSDRPQPLERLESEHDNLRRAWDYSVEARDGQAVAALAGSLFWFWNFGGHFGEGRTRSEEALERLGSDRDARAILLWTSGTLAWMQGDYDVAGPRLEASVADCRDAGRDDLLPMALRELAGVRLAQGKLTAAAEVYEESVARFRASQALWDLALGLVMLADVSAGLGRTDVARERREEARVLFGRIGDPWGLSLTHFGLGVDAASEGDLDAARIHGREALALQAAAGDDWNIGQILVLLGEIELRGGRLEPAAEHVVESVHAFRAVGDDASLVHALMTLAEVERRRGRTLRAVRLAGAGHAQAERLEGAYPYAVRSDAEPAGTAEMLRRAAGDEAFVEEWAAGCSMPFDEAVALAIEGVRRHAVVPSAGGEDGAVAALRVFALGAPEVFRARRRLRAADWTYALPKELLFYLLVHGPRTKEQIGLDFWPEASNDQLRGRFRTTLYQLRRALGGREWIVHQDGRYAFNRDLDYWFDVEAFEFDLDEAARVLDADPGAAAARLQHAVDRYRGNFLDGETPGPWASVQEDRLRRRHLDALLTLGRLRASAGRLGLAAELYRRAVACDELHEEAHCELARSLARSGDRTGALRQLGGLASTLGRELDAEPSPETAELRARLEAGESV